MRWMGGEMELRKGAWSPLRRLRCRDCFRLLKGSYSFHFPGMQYLMTAKRTDEFPFERQDINRFSFGGHKLDFECLSIGINADNGPDITSREFYFWQIALEYNEIVLFNMTVRVFHAG